MSAPDELLRRDERRVRVALDHGAAELMKEPILSSPGLLRSEETGVFEPYAPMEPLGTYLVSLPARSGNQQSAGKP